MTIDVCINLENWLIASWLPGQKGITISYISSFLIVLCEALGSMEMSLGTLLGCIERR